MWDVMGIVKGGFTLGGTSAQNLSDLADGIIKVLPLVTGDHSLWTQCPIMPRTTTPPMNMSDCSYLNTLLDHASAAIFPEQIAWEFRDCFR
jgi:hypothetical protein